jgi:hypothetical protein
MCLLKDAGVVIGASGDDRAGWIPFSGPHIDPRNRQGRGKFSAAQR